MLAQLKSELVQLHQGGTGAGPSLGLACGYPLLKLSQSLLRKTR